MKCPNCGWTMNHHADKALLDSDEDNGKVGSKAIEAFSCPHCGTNASRTLEA